MKEASNRRTCGSSGQCGEPKENEFEIQAGSICIASHWQSFPTMQLHSYYVPLSRFMEEKTRLNGTFNACIEVHVLKTSISQLQLSIKITAIQRVDISYTPSEDTGNANIVT